MSEFERFYRKTKRMHGLELLFTLFLELLKICTGSNLEETDNRPLSPQMRAEVRKLDKYTEDTQLLREHHINTEEELILFRDGIRQQIHELEHQRSGIYNKIRRAEEPEKSELKEQARAISKQIAPLRKQLRCTNRIWERSMNKVRALLEQEKKMEAQVMQRHEERGYVR